MEMGTYKATFDHLCSTVYMYIGRRYWRYWVIMSFHVTPPARHTTVYASIAASKTRAQCIVHDRIYRLLFFFLAVS